MIILGYESICEDRAKDQKHLHHFGKFSVHI